MYKKRNRTINICKYILNEWNLLYMYFIFILQFVIVFFQIKFFYKLFCHVQISMFMFRDNKFLLEEE